MQKNSLHINLLKSQELLVAKRLIELVSSEKEKMKVVEKANSELAIEDFLGRKPEEAEVEIEKKLKVSQDEINDMVKNWSWKGQWTPAMNFTNFRFDGANLSNMEGTLEEIARERIKLKAGKLTIDEELISKHAKGSIMLLKEKREVLREFKGDIESNLKQKEKALERINKAKEGLGFFRRYKITSLIFNSDLELEVKKLKQMKERANTIQGRIDGESARKSESQNKVRDLDGKLRSIILSHDEKVAGDLDRVIRGELVDTQDAYPGGLEGFFEAHPDLGISEMEKKTCRTLLKYLKEGSLRAYVTGSRLGTFSSSDVEAYYLDKYMDRGALNKENDKVKDRIERLKSLPLGQHILLNNQEFAVIRKPTAKYNGYIVKNGSQIGFIDVKNMEKPVLTLQEGDGSYVSWNLSAKKNEFPSLTAVEFSAEEIKLQSSTTAPQAAPQAAPEPAASPEPTATSTPTPTPNTTP